MTDKHDKDQDDAFRPDFEDTVDQSADQGHDEQRPLFNPFADVGKVDTGIGAVLNGPAVNPAEGGMVNKEGVGPASSSMPQVEEEDVVPGSGRDLWVCPHCDAKNKPGRATCRSCGKSPEEPVASKRQQKVVLLAGAAVLVVIAIAFAIWGGTDTGFKPAGAASIDSDIRVGGERLAATGRVLQVSGSDYGQRSVLLVFGLPAADDADFAQLRPEIDSQILVKRGQDIADELMYAQIHLVSDDELPPIQRGDYLSVAGADVRKDALLRFEYVVRVDQIDVRSP